MKSILCEDILRYINEFICKKTLVLEKDILECMNAPRKDEPCMIIKYKNLSACKKHDCPDLYSCLKTLSWYIKNKPNPRTIHFVSESACKYASNYKNDFGVFSHFCCGGQGMMFLDKEYKIERLFLQHNSRYNNYADINNEY